MGIKISLLTWNCGNKAASSEDLEILKNFFIGNNNTNDLPDMIVIGLQETYHIGGIGSIGGISFGEALKNKLSAYHYIKIHDDSMKGMTKLNELPNAQHLAVLCRGGGTILGNKKNHCSTSLSGKGGVFCHIMYRGIKFTFCTSHLDSNSDSKRNKDIECIMGKMKYPTDCTFFMGDLNYRLSSKILSSQGILTSNPSVLAGFILHPKLREKLWTADTLSRSVLIEKYKFIFPKPTPHLFFPSYKYHKSGREAVAKLDVSQDNLHDPGNMENALKCFFNGQNAMKTNLKRHDVIDLGWLDRIGYTKYNESLKICVNEMKDIPNLISSDHAAIVMNVTVSNVDTTFLKK